jgi:mannose-1-phosphate guanylyltransferase
MDKNNFALIMAGGQGTRFWPWSTEKKPKQFLPVVGNESLIAQTYERLKCVVPESNIFVVADARYLPAVKESIPAFVSENFIAEPSPKNTAPCLMLANIVLSRIAPDASLLVTPADHYIGNVKAYAAQMKAALKMAEERCIITAGIPPDSPHTGYGYIQADSKRIERIGEYSFQHVLGFREKPDRTIAETYVRDGDYFWNSGQFIYKLSHFRDLLAEYSPEYFEKYLLLEKADQSGWKSIFDSIRPDSIDYVLMEKAAEILMMGARFDWNDVGSWTSVYEMNEHDEKGNAKRGEPILIDSESSLAFSTDGRPLALIGMRNVAVIATENGILVADRNELQRVKEIIEKLKKQKVDTSNIRKN